MQVGGAEPPGWQAQTREFAEVCRAAGCSVEVIVLPGETHFSILRSLAHIDHPLTRKMISACDKTEAAVIAPWSHLLRGRDRWSPMQVSQPIFRSKSQSSIQPDNTSRGRTTTGSP
jgi:hypothetical protein